jgi:hypothetical protein
MKINITYRQSQRYHSWLRHSEFSDDVIFEHINTDSLAIVQTSYEHTPNPLV